jgi:hypothetical protein
MCRCGRGPRNPCSSPVPNSVAGPVRPRTSLTRRRCGMSQGDRCERIYSDLSCLRTNLENKKCQPCFCWWRSVCSSLQSSHLARQVWNQNHRLGGHHTECGCQSWSQIINNINMNDFWTWVLIIAGSCIVPIGMFLSAVFLPDNNHTNTRGKWNDKQ